MMKYSDLIVVLAALIIGILILLTAYSDVFGC